MPGLIRIFLLLGLFFFGLGSCSTPPEPVEPEFVLKTDLIMVYQEEFAQELDLKLAAYPFDVNQNPLEYNELVLDLVSSFSEELVILSAAKAKGIWVDKSELQAAETYFREDYPEESFEKMLLENAISYVFWKKRLEKNLIMEKFIQQELTDKIEITTQDLVAFYNKHLSQKLDEKELLSKLRMEKSQDFYGEWIMELKKNYPMEMNEKILARFLIKDDKGQTNKGQNND